MSAHRTRLCWAEGVLSPTWLEREGKPCDDAGRIEAILQGIETWTLVPGLAGYAYPGTPDPTLSRLFGNFVEVSGGFQIETDDPELIARYNKLVRANVNSSAYRVAKRDDERRAAAKLRR